MLFNYVPYLTTTLIALLVVQVLLLYIGIPVTVSLPYHYANFSTWLSVLLVPHVIAVFEGICASLAHLLFVYLTLAVAIWTVLNLL